MLEIPVLDKRDVLSSNCSTTALVVRERRPPQSDGVRRVIGLKVEILQERLDRVGKLEIVIFRIIFAKDCDLVRDAFVLRSKTSNRDRVNHRIEIVSRKVRVLCADVKVVRLVIDWNVHSTRERIVKVRERDFVLGANLLTNDNFVDVIELEQGC